MQLGVTTPTLLLPIFFKIANEGRRLVICVNV